MRLLAAGLGVAALAAMTTPAVAATRRATVTVTASGNATRVVTLTRPVTFDLARATVSGGGALAGFFLVPEPADGAGAVGAAFWRHGNSVAVRRTGRTSVPAGRYLLRVTTRAAVRFTVPATGLPSTTWRPTARLAVKEHRATWTTGQGPLALGGVSVALTASSLVLMRMSYRATTFGEEVRACVGPDGRPPGCTSEEGMYVKNEDRAGEANASGAFLVVVNAPRVGQHSARWQITAYGTVTTPEAYAVVVG